MTNTVHKICSAVVPDRIPRRDATLISRVCQWCLEKFGWQIEGEMHNSEKLVCTVAPHTSNWDFVLGVFILFALRLKVSFFGKHTLFNSPLGGLFTRLGGIPVERRQAHGMVESIAEAIRKQHKILLVIAPEGTRSPVYPWKKGSVLIAHKADIPLQCVGFDYARKRVLFGPVLLPSDNIDNQMQTLYAFYANVAAKFPEKCLVTEPKA
ncbi:acyltransferase [Alteromonas aestuariivivens]|uniref:Acyltransferase n=1 Tax=Alteromonas aestuariivivens TaxID=1938339 RepID=A0A3D8MAG8_9ALTE|nr:1-acyl-sn-glycerol-3-phosphate acyltransferase [Alteromonas aestuariivivens]RDV27354.1 acyltransferase [Alteromonas aestuariivivens]